MVQTNGKEATYKAEVVEKWFPHLAYRPEIDNIDIVLVDKGTEQILIFENIQQRLWMEAKADALLEEMFAQLILTIGKAKSHLRYLAPAFIGVVDRKKIAFLPFYEVLPILCQNDFNWKVRPSDQNTKEFVQIKELVKRHCIDKAYVFYFGSDDEALRFFIKENLNGHKLGSAILIDKNNYLAVYDKWVKVVKPSIPYLVNNANVEHNLIDGDFFLADLLSEDNITIKRDLFVILERDHYESDRIRNEFLGITRKESVDFSDGMEAHRRFWKIYKRPPEFDMDLMVRRRDLLVPFDIRERKGAFYTPQLIVEKSQEYLARVFGKDWQDEYYIWDCAAGTGNLLAGLLDKYRIWASTIDKADVAVMRDRINNGANLLASHVFQFDFLNDPLEKLPGDLQAILKDPIKREKLVIYINPPYGEAGNLRTARLVGKHKPGVTKDQGIYEQYKKLIGNAALEKFSLFFMRIYEWLPEGKLAAITKPKYVNSPNFVKFREVFKAKYLDGFIFDDSMHDNATGHFPCAFFVWDLNIKENIEPVTCDAIDRNGNVFTRKTFKVSNTPTITRWISGFKTDRKNSIGFMVVAGSKFQHQDYLRIESDIFSKAHFNFFPIKEENLLTACVYYAVRWSIKVTWVNDSDHFYTPDPGWQEDIEFQNDSLMFTLFHFNNKIRSQFGTNHWIPFFAKEVDAANNFESDFMAHFIKKREFSPEALAVYEAGLALWRHYHKHIQATPAANPTQFPPFFGGRGGLNASYYDIREYFCGRTNKGTLKSVAPDATYNTLNDILKSTMDKLAHKIQPKIYEYNFLV